ncbi:hypothetical protein GCM10025859_19180 [Alicyclobacillus fastidiosus]|nr:hypothetical protein [Alicyclobacillus fastidiosus]GMA61478.1 hypothetical protein GCM10025859_19180 [Alicyclobacillus fastidiosus]
MEPVIIGFLDQMSQESLSRGTPPASVETASAKMRDVERGRSLLEARKRRLWDAYERESITLEELSERLKRIEQEERALNDQEVGTNQEKTNDEPSRPSIAEVTQRLSVGWESLQPLQRKELARALIERIDVDREHIQVQLKRM